MEHSLEMIEVINSMDTACNFGDPRGGVQL